jgi:hypothetical protein
MENHLLRERMQIRGGFLAQFLNGASSSTQRRVLRLRDCCLRLQEHLDTIAQTGRHVMFSPVPSTRAGKEIYRPAWYCAWGADKKVGSLLKETNRLLARYTYRRAVPFMFPVTQGELPTLRADVQARLKAEREETLAVDVLLSLAEWRNLDWVQPCPVCKRWFMRGRKDQVFCGQQCLQKHFVAQRDPVEQAKKMREYRKEKKEREKRQEQRWIKGEHHAKKERGKP